MPSEQLPSEQPAKPPLGRLEKLDPRYYWRNEDQDFIHWLTQEDNMQLLGEAVGLELEVVLDGTQAEALQSDLLCRDVATGRWVLVGNQLEPTDEHYLGRLLTDAADISASAIVWIASTFLPEHRAALIWLNQVTQAEVQFFGLEIELWRIGSSAMAANFKLVTPAAATPVKEVQDPMEAIALASGQATSAAMGWHPEEIGLEEIDPEKIEDSEVLGDLEALEDLANPPLDEPAPTLLEALQAELEHQPETLPEPLSEQEQQNLAFWISLCDALEQRGSIVKPSAPVPGDRIGFAIGRAGFRLYAAIHRADNSLQVGLHLCDEDAQAYLGLLWERQDLVEAEIDAPLAWDAQTDAPNCVIYGEQDADLDSTARWPAYIDWLCQCLEQFHETFSERIKVLNALDYRKPFGKPFHKSASKVPSPLSHNALPNSLSLPT